MYAVYVLCGLQNIDWASASKQLWGSVKHLDIFWSLWSKNGLLVQQVLTITSTRRILCTQLCTKGSCFSTHVPSLINQNCFGLGEEFPMFFFLLVIQERIQTSGAYKPYGRKMFNQSSFNEPGNELCQLSNLFQLWDFEQLINLSLHTKWSFKSTTHYKISSLNFKTCS